MKKTVFLKRVIATMLVLILTATSVDLSAWAVQAAKKSSQSVTLKYSDYTLKKGKKVKLKAVVKGKQKKLVWSSSNSKVASVNSKGVVKGLKKGTAKITVKIKGTKKKDTCKIRVGTPVSKVTVSESQVTLNVGESKTITGKVSPSSASNKKVTYSVADFSIATVNNKGTITAIKEGTTTVTVKAADGSNKKATVSVVVKSNIVQPAPTFPVVTNQPIVSSGPVQPTEKPVVKVTGITVSVPNDTLLVGDSVKATAVVLPADAANKEVKWTSSNDEVATVDEEGNITAKAVGIVSITATSVDGSDISDFVYITVNRVNVSGIEMTPQEVNLEKDETKQLEVKVLPENAENKNFKYVSNNTNVAIVTETGLIRAINNGYAVITAITEEGEYEATCNVIVGTPVTDIELSDTTKTIKAGSTYQLTATVEPEDASANVLVWSSSDESVVTVDNTGKITAVKDGIAYITAETPDKKVSDTCEIVVSTTPTHVILNSNQNVMNIGDTYTLTANILPETVSIKNVVWSSSDETVATVADGVVTAKKAGNAVITATTVAGGLTATCNITVGNVETVETISELNTLLNSSNRPEGIIYESDNTESIEIEAGDYSDVLLVVDAPNATITNNARFKKIDIKNISENTWIEKAVGNLLNLFAKKSHVVVEGEDTSIEVSEGAENVSIENNGTINDISVNAQVDIKLDGTNRTEIPIEATIGGTTISTSIQISLDALVEVALNIKPGAENSSVTIASSAVIPVITGIGVITVTNNETGGIFEIVADNNATDEEIEELDKGTVSGIVKDADDNLLEGALVCAIPYSSSFTPNNKDTAIQAAKDDGKYYETFTLEDGTYTMPQMPYGNYTFIVSYSELQTHFQTLTLNQSDMANGTTTLLEHSNATGGVSGTLYNAFDAMPVPEGITLYIREGSGNVVGTVVKETTTNANGMYEFTELTPGTYTIQVVDVRDVADPFVRVNFDVVILPDEIVVANMSISKLVQGDQLRFVLTWAKEDSVNDKVPSDLDSHLTGPTVGNYGKFHVYYSDMTHSENDEKYVDLDVDDTSYEGPETTTVYNEIDGEYHFYIHNYTDRSDSNNTRLATSQAVVNVYRGTQVIATYNVPNQVGTLWDVCTYNSATNTLTPINKIYYHDGDTSEVGVSPVDLAKRGLGTKLETMKSLYFGDEVASDIEELIEKAEKILEESEDVTEINAVRDEIEEYYYELLDSTRISNISSEEIRSYNIYRMDEYDYEGYSVINLTVYGTQFPNDIQVTLYDENASYVVKESDKADYEKLIEVTNSITKAVEKYYVDVQEYVPSMYPQSITVEGNYISYYDTWSQSDGTYVLEIGGENETLGTPVITYESDRLTYTYESIADNEDYVGKVTVTYGTTVREYWVKYIRSIRKPNLQSIAASGSAFVYNDYRWENVYDENGDYYDEYKVYEFSGTKAVLDGSENYIFQVSPVDVTLTKVEGKPWNYELKTNYLGREDTLYLDYKNDMSVLPIGGEYDGGYYSFETIELIGEGDEEKVLLTDYLSEQSFTYWDSIDLYGSSDALSYEVITEGDEHYLVIYINEEELVRYPVYYEENIGDRVSIDSVVDGDNYISDYHTGSGWNGSEYIYYLYVYGENETLGNDVQLTNYYDGLELPYESVDNSDEYVGKVTLTYKSQTRIYWVKYEQQIRTPELQSVAASGQAYSVNGYTSESGYDDNGSYYSRRIYKVSGTSDILTGNETYEFQIDAEVESFTEVEDKNWDYELKVTYKGTENVIYIKYSNDMSILPTGGTYDNGWYTFDCIELIGEGSEQKVLLTDYINEENFTYWDDIELYSSSDALSYEVITEGDENYLVIFINEEELVRYPVYYEENISEYISIQNVVDGDNYISSIYTDSIWNGSDYTYYLYVYGENETLGADVQITNYYDELELSYEPVEDSEEYVGKMTATYKSQTRIYWVKYTQQIRTPELQSVTSLGEAYSVNGYSTISGYDDNGNYYNRRVYKVSGTSETLTGDETYGFQIDAEVESFTEVEDMSWDYELKITYKGIETVIGIKYSNDLSILPTSGKFDGRYSFDSIELVGEGSDQKVLLTHYKDEENFTYWDDIELYSSSDALSYEIITEGDEHCLVISLHEEELVRYPVYYEKNVYRNISIQNMVDGDNYFTEYYTSSNWDGSEYYLYVYGENESLGTDVQITSSYDDLELSYEPVEDSEVYVGKMTVTYKSQTGICWVKYQQEVRTPELTDVSSPNQAYIVGDCTWTYGYDENDNYYARKVYELSGTSDSLTGNETYGFQVDAEVESFTAVEAEDWDYELKVSYKGTETVMYINYSGDLSVLPQ